MIKMVELINNENKIPVDEWDTEANPIQDTDRIFGNIKGEIILPLAELYSDNSEESKALDYFVMSPKKSYNTDEVRDHVCRYLNYFEKFYDTDKELLMMMFRIKLSMDFLQSYKKENFVDDINRYIIKNRNLTYKIRNFVEDNYSMNLGSNNTKTPNLQFNNKHAKVLYEVSLLTNMYIPLAMHFMYIHGIRRSEHIRDFMVMLFDLCNNKYKEERNIDIYNKIYETAASIVNKSKGPDKVLWDICQMRGINPTIHTLDSIYDVIFNIIPKYTYNNNIIHFNYYSNRQALRYKITDIQYEFNFGRLSSSKRDEDNNSEYDRFEARLNKKDEALAMQNKVAAEQTVLKIEALYGPFTDAEIEFYRRALTKNGAPIINQLQKQLVGYLFDKEFGDPVTLNAIKNGTDYIKLIIAAKRILLKSGMTILPYIISSKVLRTASRKIISKKDMCRIETSNLYEQIKNKYRNPKIEQRIWEFISTIVSSTFEIIDCDQNGNPLEYNGIKVPIILDIVYEELMFFICNI